MTTKSVLVRNLLLSTIIFLLITSFGSIAQPQLKIDSVVVAFPDVKLYFNMDCSFFPQKNNYSVKENGIPVTNFSFFYLDTTRQHCCMSTAIVIDRSGSMASGSPSGLDVAKAGAKAFVDGMDGMCDEATLVSYSSAPTVDVFMTNDKVLLKNGIDGLQANGSTSLWDAALIGVQEIINNGTQTCKSLIIVNDGVDNSSSHTLKEVILAAKTAGIPVFPIGLGTYVDDSALQELANQTGGFYTKIGSKFSMVDAFKSIFKWVSTNGASGEIIYIASCLDGSERQVDLMIDSALGCPGTVIQTKKYNLPIDPSTFQLAEFKIGSIDSHPGKSIEIPLSIETNINDTLNGVQFEIQYDPICLSFLSLNTTGYLLDSNQIDIKYSAGGFTIRVANPILNTHPGILAMLRFQVPYIYTDWECPIAIKSLTFLNKCLKPIFTQGKVTIVNQTVSLVSPIGNEIWCAGSTHTISWTSKNINRVQIYLSGDGGITYPTLLADGIPALLGSWDWQIPSNQTSGSTFRILIRDADLSGAVNYSMNIFRINSQPSMKTQLLSQNLCAGDTAIFKVAISGTPFPSIQWQMKVANDSMYRDITGETNAILIIPKSSLLQNLYLYRVRLNNACAANIYSDSAMLIVNALPSISTQPANSTTCEGSTVTLNILAIGATSYQWLKNGSVISGATSGTLIIKNIQDSDEGNYSVQVINVCGQILSNTAALTVMNTTAITVQPVTQTVNQNKSVTFNVNAIGSNLTYQWKKNGIDIPGATSASFTISSAKKSDEGNYTVVITGQCGPVIQSNIVTLSVTLVDVKQTSSPSLFYLGQNYPNPFTQTTTIKLPLLVGEGRVEDSQWRGEVFFKIYDIFGREVLDLSKQVIGNFISANPRSSLVINDAQLPSPGIYFYRLTVGNESQTKMMTLIK